MKDEQKLNKAEELQEAWDLTYDQSIEVLNNLEKSVEDSKNGRVISSADFKARLKAKKEKSL